MASQVDAENVEDQTPRSPSQVDAKVCKIKSPSSPKTSLSDWYYDMSKQGLAILFNHYEYVADKGVKVPKRTGTNFDTHRIKDVLEGLNFHVEVYNDYKLEQIEKTLRKAAKYTKDEISCLIIIVMTHGDRGVLRASDYEYRVDMLWEDFTSTKCPKLAGVPKLFFIQACRGDKVDPGITVCDGEGDTPPKGQKLPSMADILQMYSTYQDHASWREDDGTWFIQSLCEVLETETDRWDLMQLLTFVNRKVALEYESFTLDPASNRMKQIPQVVSMLTKLLKFRKREDA